MAKSELHPRLLCRCSCSLTTSGLLDADLEMLFLT